ncbi:MAG: sulfite exporter TauE/SafE family protein [Defluviicoccus sp.]|nr:sulfite exporter TauE/SafE family protein [Defluviicoccus sp.]MDG4593559.1 sulfite exporter TauE/SafE family protein [Defluviicoccus sp.]
MQRLLTSDDPKSIFETSALRESQGSIRVGSMFDPILMFVGAVFAVAGVVKGVIGLGLPTISMGLLAIVMPPVHAAAILLVPSLVTNVWQMVAGPALAVVLRRLWPMMLAVCIGTWSGLGLMTGAAAPFGTALLGVALTLYAMTGLAAFRLSVPNRWEPILSPMVGAITGLITAATGVFVIPAVPYLQAIGLEKEELVQALGLSFTVSTLALAVNVGVEGGLQPSMALDTIAALALACVGMWVGQTVRLRMSPAAFRRWFFAGLLVLGTYLIFRSVG